MNHKSGNSSKVVLHEMDNSLQELMGLDHSDDEDSTAIAFFHDSSENIKLDSSSEADVKDVSHALADMHAGDDSDFKIGVLQA